MAKFKIGDVVQVSVPNDGDRLTLAKISEIGVQDGEADYLCLPLNPNASLCSGRFCRPIKGCAECEHGRYRSGWYLEREVQLETKAVSNE